MKNLDVVARLKFLEKIGNDPIFLKNIADHLSELENGAWAQSFIDCVYQYSWHHKPDLYGKYILFDTIHQLNGEQGDYLVFQVKVPDSPYADKDTEENNNILKLLPTPFNAEFIGGNYGEDGYFSWERPIHTPIKINDTIYWLLLDTNTLPLEVGTNSSSKFSSYMRQQGGIARWPYEAMHITVFINRRLIKAYAINSSIFDELISKCEETIDDCFIERNPWERWKTEVNSAQTKLTTKN